MYVSFEFVYKNIKKRGTNIIKWYFKNIILLESPHKRIMKKIKFRLNQINFLREEMNQITGMLEPTSLSRKRLSISIVQLTTRMSSFHPPSFKVTLKEPYPTIQNMPAYKK